MGSFQVRTDLALEARESVQDSSGQIRGVKYEEENNKNAGIHVTKVTIETKNGAKAMGKPMGIYITLEVPGLAEPDEGYHREVSEELAHQLGFLKDDESIMNAAYPESFAADFGLTGERVASIMKMVDDKFQLIKGGRTLRLNSNIAPGKKIRYHIKAASPAIQDFLNAEMANMLFLLNASEISISPDEFKSEDGAQAPSILGNAGAIYLPLSGLVDVQAEIEKLNKQKKELQGWIKGTESKLGNAAFVAKAPPAVVEASKKQLAELKEKLERVEESLAAYSK